jgi:LmbE family N-acetylglucosaminyl deacetylase
VSVREVEHVGAEVDAGADAVDRVRRGLAVRLLGVWAHPDDEAYLSAGLMGRVSHAGGRVACLTATRGELGRPPDDPRSKSTFEALREAELRASLRAACAHSLRILGHPDGGCDAIPHERAVGEVVRAIEAVRPDVIVTFGRDGITGHRDHVAVHRWVTDAWARTGIGELLYAVMTDAFLERYRALHDRIGVFGDHEPVGYPVGDVALRIDLDDRELARKRRALAAHASQTTALAEAVGEATYRSWWGGETFVRATRPGR